MALVTVQRSPSVTNSPQNTESGITTVTDDDEFSRSGKSLSECYFASKGAAVVLSSGSSPGGGTPSRGGSRRPPPASASSSDIQQHLQSMFYLLRPEETLKMAVKLESAHPGRTRYLVVVSRGGSGSNVQGSRAEEACLLGIDCNRRTTVGLVLRVLADTAITLDGDGGFSVGVAGRQHIFKPVSVQAMWSALQTLHRVSSGAREQNYFMGGNSHSWVNYYEQCIHSDRSCLNEWHAMDSIESRRPPSPDSVRTKPREREETEQVIRSTLKEIMMSVDLDEVTSKVIRGRLEEDLDMDLGEFKPFIDQEMITILGQMDAPTEIFDHVYLGSEWNASNLEELQKNGVRHILNVTREIDNFFPGMFNYLNIRVYDDEKTDLLKHWDKTFKYISRARKEGSKVLVHCKMGVSRSASVVIAYAMKAFDWDFSTAMKHVKEKRNCIKPNTSFLSQLETYQGILDAMKNKEKLQRSKSETNLKSPGSVCKTDSRIMEPTPLIQALTGRCRSRPRSWSPDTRLASQLLPPTSLSLENLAQETKNVLMPCANGSYSVSQNRIMRLREDGVPSVKHIVNELESQAAASEKKTQRERRNLKLNLANHIGSAEGHNCDVLSSSNVDVDAGDKSEECEAPGDTSSSQYVDTSSSDINIDVVQSKETVNKTETWDPGESKGSGVLVSNLPCDLNEIVKCDSGIVDVRTKSACAGKQGDPFSKQVDNVFEKEERRSGEAPSRQGSWSSYDSAVVLERNSSWGSYDTRPSRNSSWSSYDEQWSTGTVKRTKQKLEENSVKKICPDGDLAPSEVNEAINTVLTNKLSIVIPSACDLDIINENHEQSSVSVINSDNSVVVCLKDATGASTDSGGCEVRDMCRKSDNVSAILRELEYAGDELSGVNRVRNTKFTRLSASAPTASSNYFEKISTSPSASSVGNIFSSKNIDLPKTSIVKAFFHSKHKNKTDNFKVDKTRVTNANNNNNNSTSISGKVKNLKMEFEAKSNLNNEATSRNLLNVDASVQNVNVENNNKTKGRSLPSSPVSIHTEIRSKPIVDDDTESNGGQVGQTTSLEDLTVKQLVGKYDRPKSQQITSKTNFAEPPVPMRQSSLNLDTKKKQLNPGARNSICGGIPPRNPAVTLRPPVMPTVVAMSPVKFPTAKVVVASVVAKAQTKKQLQHGKTHPLARLKNHTTNRCTNPVYNTM